MVAVDLIWMHFLQIVNNSPELDVSQPHFCLVLSNDWHLPAKGAWQIVFAAALFRSLFSTHASPLVIPV
jgi:hypothetical protein